MKQQAIYSFSEKDTTILVIYATFTPRNSIMKYSQSIGIVLALALTGICFIPWSYIPSIQTTLTGMSTGATQFGRPGVLTIVFSLTSAVLFLVPRIWSKRLNVIVAAIGLSWAVRNYLLLSACLMGECPEKKAGLYLLLLLTSGVMLMSLIPKLAVSDKQS